MLNKRYPDIIEIKKETTEKQIQLLQKMNPYSIILKEDSEILKWMYSNLEDLKVFLDKYINV